MARFFNEQTAQELVSDGIKADLLVGNNVLAHVPDLNGFIKAMRVVLKPQGIITMEFPHLMRLMEENQFDTIYHEHFSYFSFVTVERVFAHHGLRLFDVEELPTHGGSLRIFACHAEDGSKTQTSRVESLRNREEAAGLNRVETYSFICRKGQRNQAAAAGVHDWSQTRGQNHRWVWGTCERQHPFELLWDSFRLPRLHRRPQSA